MKNKRADICEGEGFYGSILQINKFSPNIFHLCFSGSISTMDGFDAKPGFSDTILKKIKAIGNEFRCSCDNFIEPGIICNMDISENGLFNSNKSMFNIEYYMKQANNNRFTPNELKDHIKEQCKKLVSGIDSVFENNKLKINKKYD